MQTTAASFFDLSAEQHEAAAAALGGQVGILIRVVAEDTAGDIGRHERGLHDGLALAAKRLATEAARHAHQAERERERMAAVLMAQVSKGSGPELTADEIERATRAFKTCERCGGSHLADRSCGCFDNGGE